MTRQVQIALATLFLAPGVLGAQAVARRPAETDARRARVTAGVARLYDTTVLHRIEVVIAEADLGQILSRDKTRVRCTVTLDGRTIRNVGVRQSGGVFHAYQPITNKPSLSLKFDEFVDGQTLFDLDKLVLKNELQDVSFLSEHLAYEIFRRAGLAAPLTAHARVSINGIDSGIYLMREPIDREFLTRNFGSAARNGNLYEIENLGEFVFDPSGPALDDEGKNGRTRRDLVALAKAVEGTSAVSVGRDLSPLIDLDRLVTFVAAEIATKHWDGLTSRNNNTYLYARPPDGRFVFIPWGADQALGLGGGRGFGGLSLRSFLVQKLFEAPEWRARVEREIARIQSAPVWHQADLLARVERLGQLLAPLASTVDRTGSDVARFQSYRQTVEAIIRSGGR